MSDAELLDRTAASARDALRSAVDPTPPDLRRIGRARRGRRAVGGVLVVVLVVAIAAASLAGRDRGSKVVTGPSDDPSTTSSPVATTELPNADLLDPGQTAPIAPSPLAGRSTLAAVWTGDRVVFWGGDSDRGTFADGATYDPRADAWSTLPAGPLNARNEPASAWTGREVVLWGGSSADAVHRDGAAFDPTTNTWRRIADAPFTSEGRPVGLWTGSELIVLAGFNSRAAGSYDPAADRWTRLPDLPANLQPPTTAAVWTGSEVVAVVQDVAPLGADELATQVVSWRPGDDGWTELGALPSASVALAATDDGVLVASGREAFLLRGSERTPVATAPDDRGAADAVSAWTGRELLLWSGDTASAIDPVAGTWRTLPSGGTDHRTQPAFVWADGVGVGWGGFPDDATGVVLRPD